MRVVTVLVCVCLCASLSHRFVAHNPFFGYVCFGEQAAAAEKKKAEEVSEFEGRGV
jgi:hypothetical protein